MYYSLDSGSTWSKSNAPGANWWSMTSDSSGQYLAAGTFQGNAYKLVRVGLYKLIRTS